MRTVAARLPAARFSAAMAAMREWLDRKSCELEHFGTEAGEGGSIIIKAQFAEDDLADLFRREFQGNYGD